MPRFSPTVEIAPGATVTGNPSTWSWTDLSMQGFVHNPSGIVITRGRSDRFSDASPDTCALTLLNDGGRFVPRNPLGPWYGRLAQGTPIRVLMRPHTNSASDAFSRTASSSWGTADSGGAWTVVGTAADYAVSTTNGGRMTQGTANVQHVAVLPTSVLRVDLQVRVRVNALSTGAAQSAGLVFRYSGTGDFIRAVVEFGTTGVLTARIVHRSGGVDTPGTGVTVSGLTHSTSTWYRVRVQTGYNAVRMKVWQDGTTEPATWTLDGATTALTILTAGKFGCFALRATGNTNASATTDFDDFSMLDGPRTQFTGFVDAWPIRWNDPGLAQAFAPITASGQLRRLSRAKALRSAIYRACMEDVASGTSTGVAYWPMEDGTRATTFAAAIGGRAQGFTGTVNPGADSDVLGSDPLPTFGGNGSIRFTVPPYATSSTWAVRWAMKIPASSISGAAQIMSWTVPGGSPITRWQLTLNTGSPDQVSLSGWNAAGTASFTGTSTDFTDPSDGSELSDGRQLYFEVTGTQNGANIDTSWTVWFAPNNPGFGSSTNTGFTQSTASTNANIGMIYHDASTGFANGGHTIGHVAVATDDLFGAFGTGVDGGANVQTDIRFRQLCDELGVTGYVGDLVRGTGTSTQLMGPQSTGDVLSQLREIEATEVGIVHDGKSGFLELLPRSMRYNRTVDLTLDVDQQHVHGTPEPTDDDNLLRNSITVDNAGSSSASSEDATSIALQGVHSDSVDVNVYRDDGLQAHADWRKNLGVSGGLRWPSIVVNLTKKYSDLENAWFDTDIGSRIQVTNVPSGELPPENLDLLLDGYTETITSSEWWAELNASDGRQWLVETLDSDNRLACSACVTAEDLDTTETGVDVQISDTCTWTHSRGDFGIYIGGELMTVTAVSVPVGSGSSWTQTLTVTRSVNGIVTSHSTGAAVTVAKPIILALGGGSMAAFSAGQTLTAADLIRPLPVFAIKAADESVISSTTLQNDNELFVSLAANTTYQLNLALLATEATGTTADLKLAWTMPSGCRLDAANVGAHTSWTGSSANPEVEFNSWQAETSTTTSTRSFGTINAGIVFGYHVRGIVTNGGTAGTLQLQWAQAASVAENVTVKAGSSLILTPLLS